MNCGLSRLALCGRGLLVLGVIVFAMADGLTATPKERKGRKAGVEEQEALTRPATAPSTFAPLPPDHPLAEVWNDPEFTRRLVGSYGFLPEAEPRMTPEEQALFRDQIVPLLREDPRKAIPALEAAIKPEASAVFDYTLGTVFFQSEDFVAAVKHYEAALAKFPDYRRAQKNLALALVREGRYAEAVRPLTRTITLGGADGRIYGLLGFALMNEERFQSALPAYQQALLYEPDNLDFQLGLVKCHLATANYEAAHALLGELLAKYPEKESLWALQARLYVQRNDLPNATVSYEILRRLGKATAPDLMLLGDIYMTREAPELALSAYLAALEQEGGQDLTRALRAAEILTSRGAWEEARRMFERIRVVAGERLTGQDELTLLKLETKATMATGAGEDAIQVLETVLRKNPLDGEALLLAGDYYARSGEPEKATFRYASAARVSGFEADAMVKHAQLLVKSQSYPAAVELLRKAQKLKPRDAIQRYLDKVEQAALRTR
ncbi:MAG: tetratricopeptide repeat protein [Limisphaerales bacterium]